MSLFYDLIKPSEVKPYAFKQPEQEQGIVRYRHWLVQKLTHLFGASIYLNEKKTAVNVASVARYICEAYFTNLKDKEKGKKLTEIKAILRQHEDATKGLDDFIASVVTNIASTEDLLGKKVSEIAEKAVRLPNTLEEATDLQNLVEKLSSRQDLVQLNSELTKRVHNHVLYLTCEKTLKQISQEFGDLFPPSLISYSIPVTTNEPPPDYSQIKKNLDTLRTYCELKQQLEKEYMNREHKNWKDTHTKLAALESPLSLAVKTNTPFSLENLSGIQKSLESIALTSLKEKISFLGDKTDQSGKTILELEQRWNALAKSAATEEHKKLLQTALSTIQQKYSPGAPLEARIGIDRVQTDPEPSFELVQAALTLQEENILQAIAQEEKRPTLAQELETFRALLSKKPETFVTSINSLLQHTKEEPNTLTETILGYFTSFEGPFPADLLQQKDLQPEMYKIIALNEQIGINTRLKAATLFVQTAPVKGIQTFKDVLAITLEQKEFDKEILEALRSLDQQMLDEIFMDNRLLPYRERLRLLTYNDNTDFRETLAGVLGFNFDPIQDDEKWISSESKNTILLSTPGSGNVDTFRNELTLALSKLRETEGAKPPIHALAFGGQGNFVARTQPEFLDILNKLHALSADFRGVTLIPGKISYGHTEVVPIFEDGRLISLARPPSSFLITPNGTSIALGIGEEPLGQIQHMLPYIPNQVDYQIAMETNERDDAQPIINSKGLLVRVTEEDTLEIASGPLATPALPVGEIGGPVSDISNYRESATHFTLSETDKLIDYLKTPQRNIFDEIERLHFFKDESDKKTFLQALQSGQIPPKYTHQFLVLFSKIQGENHSVVVYTENSSMPVQIYSNGICTNEIKGPQTILPADNRTILAYSTKDMAFYRVSPSVIDTFKSDKISIDTEWNQFKTSIATVLKEIATSAQACKDEKSVSELQEKIKALSNKQKDLIQWMSSSGTVGQFYWKKSKAQEFEEWKQNLSFVHEFCNDIISLTSPTLESQEFVNVLDKLKNNHKTLQTALTPFLEPTDVAAVTLTITQVPRAWDTILTFIQLGKTPLRAPELTLQDGRLLLDPSAKTTAASTITQTLRELKDTLGYLQVDPDEIPLIKKALNLFIQPTSEQQQRIWPLARFPSWHTSDQSAKDELKEVAQGIIDDLTVS